MENLPTVKCEMGTVIGGEDFLPAAMEKADRRRARNPSMERKRRDDRFFDSVEKVFYEFETKQGVKADGIDTTTYAGKRLRAQLLVNLKERAGLRYTDIIQFDLFGDLTLNSLASIFHRFKKKEKR